MKGTVYHLIAACMLFLCHAWLFFCLIVVYMNPASIFPWPLAVYSLFLTVAYLLHPEGILQFIIRCLIIMNDNHNNIYLFILLMNCASQFFRFDFNILQKGF